MVNSTSLATVQCLLLVIQFYTSRLLTAQPRGGALSLSLSSSSSVAKAKFLVRHPVDSHVATIATAVIYRAHKCISIHAVYCMIVSIIRVGEFFLAAFVSKKQIANLWICSRKFKTTSFHILRRRLIVIISKNHHEVLKMIIQVLHHVHHDCTMHIHFVKMYYKIRKHLNLSF